MLVNNLKINFLTHKNNEYYILYIFSGIFSIFIYKGLQWHILFSILIVKKQSMLRTVSKLLFWK